MHIPAARGNNAGVQPQDMHHGSITTICILMERYGILVPNARSPARTGGHNSNPTMTTFNSSLCTVRIQSKQTICHQDHKCNAQIINATPECNLLIHISPVVSTTKKISPKMRVQRRVSFALNVMQTVIDHYEESRGEASRAVYNVPENENEQLMPKDRS